MVSFKDLKSDAGLKELNTHLSTRSYVDGYTVSSADFALLPQLTALVDSNKYPHAARWLAHVASFTPSQRAVLAAATPAKPVASPSAPVAAAKEEEEEDDDDFMTSLSDDEEDEDDAQAAQALIAKKNAEREAAKRASKGGPQAKSSLILDVKPEDSETKMTDLLAQVKAIEMEGLTWGGHEFLPIAYGLEKLRIICVVVDDLCSTDDLIEGIEALEGCQSVDIHAFNKL